MGKEKKKKKYIYKYPMLSMTADCAVFGFDAGVMKICLVKRGQEPFEGCWALPGGFMKPEETIDQCARRELGEETHLYGIDLMPYGIYTAPKRDPRKYRVVSLAFIGLVPADKVHPTGGDDASDARWWDLDALPELAFDHAEIVAEGKMALRIILNNNALLTRMARPSFTIPELYALKEWAEGRGNVDRRNFERKLMAELPLEEEEPPADADKAGRRGRPSRYFTLKKEDAEGKEPGKESRTFVFLAFPDK